MMKSPFPDPRPSRIIRLRYGRANAAAVLSATTGSHTQARTSTARRRTLTLKPRRRQEGRSGVLASFCMSFLLLNSFPPSQLHQRNMFGRLRPCDQADDGPLANARLRPELLGDSDDDSNNCEEGGRNKANFMVKDDEEEEYMLPPRRLKDPNPLRALNDATDGDITMLDDVRTCQPNTGVASSDQLQTRALPYHQPPSSSSSLSSLDSISLRPKEQRQHTINIDSQDQKALLNPDANTKTKLTITPHSHLSQLKSNNGILRSHNMSLATENARMRAHITRLVASDTHKQQQQQETANYGNEGPGSNQLDRYRREVEKLQHEKKILVECGIEWARREMVLSQELGRLRAELRFASGTAWTAVRTDNRGEDE